MQQSRPRYVGREGQKASLAVASRAQDHGAAVVSRGTVGTRQGESDPRMRQRPSKSPPLVFVDAAGPCGDGLSRSLRKKGAGCWGVAPALMLQKAGARVKTDRRDARPRARRMRAGALPPVEVPAVDAAAIRALRRAREETRRARKAATRRRTAFVRRHASRSTGRATWRPAPRRWRREGRCPTPAPPMVVQADVQTVTAQTAR